MEHFIAVPATLALVIHSHKFSKPLLQGSDRPLFLSGDLEEDVGGNNLSFVTAVGPRVVTDMTTL